MQVKNHVKLGIDEKDYLILKKGAEYFQSVSEWLVDQPIKENGLFIYYQMGKTGKFEMYLSREQMTSDNYRKVGVLVR